MEGMLAESQVFRAMSSAFLWKLARIEASAFKESYPDVYYRDSLTCIAGLQLNPLRQSSQDRVPVSRQPSYPVLSAEQSLRRISWLLQDVFAY